MHDHGKFAVDQRDGCLTDSYIVVVPGSVANHCPVAKARKST